MSDIRKDFDKWLDAPNDSWLDEPLSVGYIQWEAYQAGRAHNIDGLIAKIDSNILYASSGNPIKQGRQLSYNEGIRTALEIIRKHFGKE